MKKYQNSLKIKLIHFINKNKKKSNKFNSLRLVQMPKKSQINIIMVVIRMKKDRKFYNKIRISNNKLNSKIKMNCILRQDQEHLLLLNFQVILQVENHKYNFIDININLYNKKLIHI